MVVFLSILVLWVVSLCLHEYAHARVAYAGGDTSVVEKGYLTLNPMRYMHPMMSLVVPLIILMIGGIPLPGGAVYIETQRLRSKHWDAAVSAAGPAANLLLMALCGIPFLLGLHADPELAKTALFPTIGCFAFLMAFAALLNLLPLPGLDGFGIIAPYLSVEARRTAYEFSRYTIFLLIALLLFSPGFVTSLWSMAALLVETVGVPRAMWIDGWRAFRDASPTLFG